MMTRVSVLAALVFFAGIAFAEEAAQTPCRLVFEAVPQGGHFVASVPAETCRARLMEEDRARLAPAHELGRTFTGTVDLSSSSLDVEAAARGQRAHRWHIALPESFDVPASVSTLFARVVSTEAGGPERIEKCNLSPVGFDLIVVEQPGVELLELQLEWIAYEYTPQATPSTCHKP